ncbi:MAG: MATE family efflux transporter [Bacillota bacterium]|nr:MATE family efflux transporter [Bacillota bacterium]
MEATKKSFGEVDFLQGSILKALVIFSIPILVSNIFQQCYNTADTMIVGNFLGDNSLAAIGSCTAIYDLLIGFAMGIGNGLSIVTSRSYGSRDEELLKKSVAGSIVIWLVCSVIITMIAVFGTYPLLQLLNTPIDIIDEAYGYIFIISLFIGVMFAYNLCAGMMRAIGNSVMPLVFLVVSSIVNIGLDILFITKLNMGIAGAAWATVIAQGISVLLCIIYVLKNTPVLVPEKRHFRIEKELYMELLGQGMSMGFMSCIVSAGSVILQYGINGLGKLVIAGHTTARKLYMFFNMPFMSMAVACSTFVGQNRGANQPKRIRKCLKICYLYDIVMAAIITVLIYFVAPSLVKFVSGSNSTVVLSNGAMYLRVVGPFYAVLGVLIQSRNALQGIGKKIVPLISSVIEFVGKVIFVLVFIPKFQYMAVVFCEPVIWCVMTIQLLYSLYSNAYMKEAKNSLV